MFLVPMMNVESVEVVECKVTAVWALAAPGFTDVLSWALSRSRSPGAGWPRCDSARRQGPDAG